MTKVSLTDRQMMLSIQPSWAAIAWIPVVRSVAAIAAGAIRQFFCMICVPVDAGICANINVNKNDSQYADA